MALRCDSGQRTVRAVSGRRAKQRQPVMGQDPSSSRRNTCKGQSSDPRTVVLSQSCAASPHGMLSSWPLNLRMAQVVKRSSQKTQARRSSLKTFVKVVNYNHVMPTRYTLDVELKGVVTPEAVDNSTAKVEARKVGGWVMGGRQGG